MPLQEINKVTMVCLKMKVYSRLSMEDVENSGCMQTMPELVFFLMDSNRIFLTRTPPSFA